MIKGAWEKKLDIRECGAKAALETTNTPHLWCSSDDKCILLYTAELRDWPLWIMFRKEKKNSFIIGR